jgi:Leucine-rich repeat (LRR) protein
MSWYHYVKDNIRSFEEYDISKDVIYLVCTKRGLESLKGLPPSVRTLFCSDNKLTTFEHLPKGKLREIWCGQNNITTFEHLPSSVKSVDVSRNPITSLEHLPSSVKWMCCDRTPCENEFDRLGLEEVHTRNRYISKIWKMWNSLEKSYLSLPPEEVITDIKDIFYHLF